MNAELNKQAVAHSFSKAANSYDGAAGFQRDVGNALCAHLPQRNNVDTVVDLGCGTGHFITPLAQHFKQPVIGLDIAEGMLAYARCQHNTQQDKHSWLAGDAEQLPLAANSVDIVFSSLAIQWCQQLPQLFAEIQRVLKPGGSMLFATLVEGSLEELKQAWQAVDGYVHVNRFFHQDVWQQAVEQSGLQFSQWQVQAHQLQYQRLNQLTGELKAIGAHNVNSGRPKGLMGRKAYQQLHQAYDQFRDDKGLLPATYQVLYGVVTNG